MNTEQEKNIKVYLQLIENSHDFISIAVSILKENNNQGFLPRFFSDFDSYKLKTALISSATAIELLLKSLIAYQDWKKIFKTHEEANYSKIQTGEFISIESSQCVKILKNDFEFKLSSRITKRIKKIGRLRNKLIHFNLPDSEIDYIQTISLGIDTYQEVYKALIEKIDTKNRIEDIGISLIEIKKYVELRKETLKLYLDDKKRPATNFYKTCHTCNLDTLFFTNDGFVKCAYCNEKSDITEHCSLLSSEVIDCPSCNNASMIYTQDEIPPHVEIHYCILCDKKIRHTTMHHKT